MRLRSLKDIEQRQEIVPVIFQRLCNRLAYSLECSKVDDSINPELGKQPVH